MLQLVRTKVTEWWSDSRVVCMLSITRLYKIITTNILSSLASSHVMTNCDWLIPVYLGFLIDLRSFQPNCLRTFQPTCEPFFQRAEDATLSKWAHSKLTMFIIEYCQNFLFIYRVSIYELLTPGFIVNCAYWILVLRPRSSVKKTGKRGELCGQ